MANIFVNLPLPALNGPGAAVNVSAMGVPKTIVVAGTFEGAAITIEASVDGGVVFAPVVTFQSGEQQKTVPFVAEFLRVHVAGRKPAVPFTANIDVGANDGGASFAAIPLPAGNGAGPSVNVSAFGSFSTFIAGGTFEGARVLVQISEDGIDWAPLVQFSGQGGQISKEVTAEFVRASVSGRKPSIPFTGSLAVGAANDPSSMVVSDPGNSNCLIFQPGGGQTGPGTFDTWAGLMAQLTAYRANANGDGCYTIKFDDSIVSPVVIPAGGPYDMTNTIWEGNGTFFGSFVEIANGASFLRLREFSNNLTVRNLNTVTSPCADLVDGDVIRISDFTNLETTTPGGVAFFDGTAVPAAGSVFVIMTESSNLGFYISGPVFSMPTAGSFLIVLCDDLSTPIAGAPGPFAGAVGAVLRLETPSLSNMPTADAAAFPGWLGTFNRPVITAAPSMLPKPYLDVASAVAQVAAFNDWLRMDVSGGPVAQTLPPISAASGFFTRPGCLLLVTEFSGTAGLTVVPAAGDSLPNGAASIAVAPGGSVLLIGDGVSEWTVVSIHNPAGQNLIVWSVGEAWADVYAEIQYTQAADPESPIIVLVAYDGGTPRVMTDNGGAPTALWMVQFQSLIPDVLNTRRVEINVDDGFILDADPDGTGVLNSQDIQWTFAAETVAPFSGGQLRVYLDGGSLALGEDAAFSFEVTGNLRIEITNDATISGSGDGTQYLFDLTGGSGLVRATVNANVEDQSFTAGVATAVTLNVDDTITVDDANAFDVNIVTTYVLRAMAALEFYDSISLAPGLNVDTVQAAIDVLKQGFGVFTFGNLNVGVVATALYLDPAYNQGASGATQIAMRATHNGLLRALCVEHNIADATSEDITYEVYVNGAATGLLVVLDSGAIGGADELVTEILVAQGDLIAIQHTKTGVLTTGIVGAVATMQFIPQA